MANRPRPDFLDSTKVKKQLEEQGATDIDATVSFVRLLIPIVIRDLGEEGVIESIKGKWTECGLDEPPGWQKKMVPHVVQWATRRIEEFKTRRG